MVTLQINFVKLAITSSLGYQYVGINRKQHFEIKDNTFIKKLCLNKKFPNVLRHYYSSVSKLFNMTNKCFAKVTVHLLKVCEIELTTYYTAPINCTILMGGL